MSYMFLWSEEALLGPPLVPAGLHELWTVGGWQRQGRVWKQNNTNQ